MNCKVPKGAYSAIERTKVFDRSRRVVKVARRSRRGVPCSQHERSETNGSKADEGVRAMRRGTVLVTGFPVVR